MSPHLERSIDRLRQRAFLGAFLGTFLRSIGAAAAILAAVALIMRTAFRFERAEVAWIFAALVVVPVVAWILARKRVPSRGATAAWLDVRAGGTGAIVVGDEIDDPRWRAQVERALESESALAAHRSAQTGPPLPSRSLCARSIRL